MLYFLLYTQLYKHISPLRVFGYTTSRTAFASLTALFLCIALGPWLINKLRYFQIGQYIREEGPRSHQKKAGTPTMGGVSLSSRRRFPRCFGPTITPRVDCHAHASRFDWISFWTIGKIPNSATLALGKRKPLPVHRRFCFAAALLFIPRGVTSIPH
jgi:hypothetical protein